MRRVAMEEIREQCHGVTAAQFKYWCVVAGCVQDDQMSLTYGKSPQREVSKGPDRDLARIVCICCGAICLLQLHTFRRAAGMTTALDITSS